MAAKFKIAAKVQDSHQHTRFKMAAEIQVDQQQSIWPPKLMMATKKI